MKQKYLLIVVVCLTLGLAPFAPEPHIAGKIRWILGGAEGMTLLDWGDTFFHGAPWLVLLYALIHDGIRKMVKR
jgi:hypothetical protein